MFHLCFLDACCNCVYLDVAYVSHICCMYFIRTLCIVAMVFKCVFLVCFSSVSESCFKCFICLQMYVAIVASRCFKVDQRCLHVAMAPVAGGQRLVAWLRLLPRAAHLALSYLSPPLSSLSFSPSRRNSSSSSSTWSSVAL
jgi:hypothetical protein